MPNFTQLMDSVELSQDCISLDISDSWTQGRTVYGGMQAAVAVRAMRQLERELPLRSLQVTFIGPVLPGSVTATATLLRQGKSTSHVQAQIVQDGKLRLTAIGIFGKNRESAAVYDSRMHPTLSPDYAKDLSDEGIRPEFLKHFDCRIIEGSPLFSGTTESSTKIYTRHSDDEGCSYEHLTALADITPCLALVQLTEPAPSSSMNWQLDFVRCPEEIAGTEWFRVDSDIVACEHGYSWQNASIWTDKGELVMVSRQCMAVFG